MDRKDEAVRVLDILVRQMIDLYADVATHHAEASRKLNPVG